MTKKVIYIICTVTGAGVLTKGIYKICKNYIDRVYKNGYQDGLEEGKRLGKFDAKLEALMDDLTKTVDNIKLNSKKSIFSKKGK